MAAQTVVKTYTGNQERAARAFQEDAASMAAKGYFPISQSYASGAYGCASFIGALLLCFVFIGIIVFIYRLLVKPDGVLTVTYELRGTAASRALDEKTCPKCAEQVKAAATVCRFCGHDFKMDTLPAAAAKSLTHDELMVKYGISHDGDQYHFQEYRYDRLEDAVAYARKHKP